MIDSRPAGRFFLFNISRRIFLSTPVFLCFALGIIYLVMTLPVYFNKVFGKFDESTTLSMVVLILYNLTVMCGLPVLFTKFIYKNKLSQVGLVFPVNKRLAALLVCGALVLIVPFIFYFAKRQDFLQYYGFGSASLSRVLVFEILVMPFYYFAEEFFFRGFLFLNLWNRVGWHSFWITDVIFTLSHFGKPVFEILLCIPVSIVFNILTLTTRSIVPAWVTHYSLGVIMLLLVRGL
jgi:membrane protease YdiL (CAAX protease family)